MIDDDLGDDDEEKFDEVLFAEGFEEAIIGVARQFDKTFVVYDYKAVMKILQRDMSPEDAVEFFEFNMVGAWMGDNTPAYLVSKAREPME